MEIKALAFIAAATTAPLGPKVLNIAGMQVPVAAMALSLISLTIARFISPKSTTRTLSTWQERAVTALLAIILFLLVTGELSACHLRGWFNGTDVSCRARPLGVGMAVTWGIGLGTTGILAIDFFGPRMKAAWSAMFGTGSPSPSPPPAARHTSDDEEDAAPSSRS